jgi:hypothetical protein
MPFLIDSLDLNRNKRLCSSEGKTTRMIRVVPVLPKLRRNQLLLLLRRMMMIIINFIQFCTMAF